MKSMSSWRRRQKRRKAKCGGERRKRKEKEGKPLYNMALVIGFLPLYISCIWERKGENSQYISALYMSQLSPLCSALLYGCFLHFQCLSLQKISQLMCVSLSKQYLEKENIQTVKIYMSWSLVSASRRHETALWKAALGGYCYGDAASVCL